MQEVGGLEVAVLGPVRASVGGEGLPLGRPMHAALLALLAVHVGRIVAVDAAIDGLWGEDPPASARTSLQVHVSRLRAALGPAGAAVATQRPGYALAVPRHAVDADRFQRLLGDARDARLDGDVDGAAERLRTGLGLWRGPAVAGVGAPFAAPVAARLEELRLVAEEDLLDVDLERGRHLDVADRSAALLGEHPLRERLWAARITALYRAGAASEALAAYQQLRSVLADELGLDPSPELQALERRVLQHDPALAAPASRAPTARPAAPPEPAVGPVAVPPVRYAVAEDGVHVAVQVLGEGPVDLVVLQSYLFQLEVGWEHEPATRLWRRLAERHRVVLLDKRGQGLSDRVQQLDAERRAHDVSAALDAAGSERAVVVGNSDGSFVGAVAAARDQRVVGFASVSGALSMYRQDRPWAPDREGFDAWVRYLSTRWGTGRCLRVLAPSHADDPATRAWMGRLERAACGPGDVERLMHVQADLDWSDLARGFPVPVLVVHRAGEVVAAAAAREIAEVVPDGRFVELPGDEHLMYLGDPEPLASAIEAFVAELLASGALRR